MKIKQIKKITGFPIAIIFIIVFFCVDINIVFAANTSMPDITIPNLEITIPGLTFSNTIECDNLGESNETCDIPWIGEYIKGVVNYGTGIASILAIVVLMFGGLIWMTAGGNTSRVGEAKAWITGSVSGLVLVLCSYLILYTINPALTVLKPIKLGTINEIKLEEIEGDSSTPMTTDKNLSSVLASGSCNDVAQSYVGKVTYNQSKRGTLETNSTIYYDCSSWANKVRTSCGRTAVTPTTAVIFQNCTPYTGNNLQPGDLIGWPPSGNPTGRGGHTYVYLGNGKYADCHGGKTHPTGGAINANRNINDIQKFANKNGIKLCIKQ